MNIITLADGNPGAMSFLIQLLSPEQLPKPGSFHIIRTLNLVPSLRGSALYVLWSDLAGQDLEKVAEICQKVPNEVLAEACSRQDYSGRELITPYL